MPIQPPQVNNPQNIPQIMPNPQQPQQMTPQIQINQQMGGQQVYGQGMNRNYKTVPCKYFHRYIIIYLVLKDVLKVITVLLFMMINIQVFRLHQC